MTAAAVRVFPGRAEEAGEARRWVRVLAMAACVLVADDAEIAAGELFANAVRHTRSGGVGGKVTAVVARYGEMVTVHMHDQGTCDDRVPHPAGSGDERDLRLSGRGLQIVAAVCVRWGTVPATWCPYAEADDPAVAAFGRCTWCRLPVAAGREGRDEKEGVGRVRV